MNDGGRHRLKRELGPVGLVACASAGRHLSVCTSGADRRRVDDDSLSPLAVGIGGIIGSGIFVLVGKAAHDCAGPALSLSFIVAGTACACAGYVCSDTCSRHTHERAVRSWLF